MNTIRRYEEALRTIPAPGTGCHAALLGVSNRGILAGIPESQLLRDIRDCIPPGRRRVPEREIKEAVQKAIAECGATGAAPRRHHYKGHRRPHKASKPFDGMKYRDKLVARSEGVSDAELWELSPYRITWEPGFQDAVEVLQNLYAPDEQLFIGGVYCKEVQPVSKWIESIGAGSTHPHIIPNPVDGLEHNTKSGTLSRRCDDAVSEYRFALVEFDNMPKADQISFWHSIIIDELLPVAALIDSGKKSIHAWIQVDLPNAKAWDREVKQGLYDPDAGRMALMGADRACSNPSRLSRLPGHSRDNGNVQRLLYLDPSTQGAT